MEHLNQSIERTTLSNLVCNEEYCRKVLPFIRSEIDKEELHSYLVDECNLPNKNITNAIKKLNNVY